MSEFNLVSARSSLFKLLIFFFASQAGFSESREYPERLEYYDIHKYNVQIEVNDSNNIIRGVTGVEIIMKRSAGEIILDLKSAGGEGPGMTVDSVLKNGVRIEHIHVDNLLRLPVLKADTKETRSYLIYYKGKVNEGLIISKNMHGERTFFTDNWPDRARHWFPCIDHPSSKSMVDFTVTAPSHYQVIATGTLQKKVSLPGKRTAHYWSSNVPVPTKVMAFAAAGFAVEYLGEIDGIPYSNWVYPENMEEGFMMFSATPKILRFFTGIFGAYPFEKIANVQSTTRFSGMENAGNIFYNERSLQDKNSIELTMVHEFAHQWFGNSVSEKDWPHLWLSEGIASWLTGWYIEENYGWERFLPGLMAQRDQIINFSKTRLVPVVDFHAENITDLLNPNTYFKGAWVLHMLRREMGDELLVRGLAEFYERQKPGTADTGDFLEILEELSGLDLEQFSDDWLYSAGHPVLSVSSSYNNGRLTMELIQTQQHKMAFTFPLDIRFVFSNGTHQDQSFNIIFRRHEFIIDLPDEPSEIILDPDTWLLFEQR